jgi:chromosome segregation ATPase
MNHVDAINEYLRIVMPLSQQLEEEGVAIDHDLYKFIHYLKDRGIFSDTFRAHVIKMHNAIDDYKRAEEEWIRAPGDQTSAELGKRRAYLLEQMDSLDKSLANGEQLFRKLYTEFQQYGGNTTREDENWRKLLGELEAEHRDISRQRTNLLTPLENAKITIDLIANEFKATLDACRKKFQEIKTALSGEKVKYTPKQVLEDITETLINLERNVFGLLNKIYTFQRGVGDARHVVELQGRDLAHISAIYNHIRGKV